MKRILVINGPNLNLLGRREPHIYGTRTLADIESVITARFTQAAEIVWKQTNSEGAIIDMLHSAGFGAYTGIVLNAGAYTHTSLAIADAIAAIEAPVVEVHLSNVYARETERRHSMIAPVCRGCISGFGAESYALAITALLDLDQ